MNEGIVKVQQLWETLNVEQYSNVFDAFIIWCIQTHDACILKFHQWNMQLYFYISDSSCQNLFWLAVHVLQLNAIFTLLRVLNCIWHFCTIRGQCNVFVLFEKRCLHVSVGQTPRGKRENASDVSLYFLTDVLVRNFRHFRLNCKKLSYLAYSL